MSAVFSPCRTWRYTLTRTLAPRGEPLEGGFGIHDARLVTVAFIGLNPSTADETVNDPTVRRCSDFAQRWGYERMVMLNLFAYRSTDPRVLATLDFETAHGPNNMLYVGQQVGEADLVVCAWGTHGARWDYGSLLARSLRDSGIELHVLGLTKHGHPKHPLYLPKSLDPVPWMP